MSDFKAEFDRLAEKANAFAAPFREDFYRAMQAADDAVNALRAAGLVVTLLAPVNMNRGGMIKTRMVVSIMRDMDGETK